MNNLVKSLKKIYYQVVPTYIEKEIQFVSWQEADELMRQDPEWTISKKEDNNLQIGWVWICKKQRKECEQLEKK